MNAQMGDIITFRSERPVMASEPQIIAPKARFFDIWFIAMNTACWRGYHAEADQPDIPNAAQHPPQKKIRNKAQFFCVSPKEG